LPAAKRHKTGFDGLGCGVTSALRRTAPQTAHSAGTNSKAVCYALIIPYIFCAGNIVNLFAALEYSTIGGRIKRIVEFIENLEDESWQKNLLSKHPRATCM
jgi:hypothetical protein